MIVRLYTTSISQQCAHGTVLLLEETNIITKSWGFHSNRKNTFDFQIISFSDVISFYNYFWLAVAGMTTDLHKLYLRNLSWQCRNKHKITWTAFLLLTCSSMILNHWSHLTWFKVSCFVWVGETLLAITSLVRSAHEISKAAFYTLAQEWHWYTVHLNKCCLLGQGLKQCWHGTLKHF